MCTAAQIMTDICKNNRWKDRVQSSKPKSYKFKGHKEKEKEMGSELIVLQVRQAFVPRE